MLKNPSFIFSWNRTWTRLSRIQNQSAAGSLVLVTHLSLGAGDATGVGLKQISQVLMSARYVIYVTWTCQI
jgi:hypothetical protein